MNRKTISKGDRFRNPTKILAFDNRLKLAAIYGSYNIAERMTGIPHQRLLKACKGVVVAVNKYYWRELEDNDEEAMIVESEDLGNLSLLDYDKEIGVDREIYYSIKMERGQFIPESQYHNKQEFIKSFKYQKWKRERLKKNKEE